MRTVSTPSRSVPPGGSWAQTVPGRTAAVLTGLGIGLVGHFLEEAVAIERLTSDRLVNADDVGNGRADGATATPIEMSVLPGTSRPAAGTWLTIWPSGTSSVSTSSGLRSAGNGPSSR